MMTQTQNQNWAVVDKKLMEICADQVLLSKILGSALLQGLTFFASQYASNYFKRVFELKITIIVFIRG